ncbi:MAG: hypothetical protein K2P85_00490 [Flavobacteriaceae bacterium]|nr:hypothetical protein [Flavobacteriaceae bacterium]
MKKVIIELSERQLNTLVYCFTYSNKFYPTTREQKVLKSILEKVSLRVMKKHLEVKAIVNTLFTKKKKSKFTFEYHEAHCIEQYLIIIEDNPFNEYDRNAILFIKNKLNQQLA